MRNHLVAILLFSSAACSADIIHLKNGTAVNAERVTENGESVEYYVGSTRYSIPKAQVSSIEHTGTIGITVTAAPSGIVTPGAPPVSAASGPRRARARISIAAPSASAFAGVDPGTLLPQIINSGHVDERALFKIEDEGNPVRSAAAYLLAAKYAYDHNEGESARKYMKVCITFAPDQPALLSWYALLLLEAGQDPEAIVQSERAAQIAPKSATAQQILGLAYYDSGRLADAVNTWRRAQEIHNSQEIASILAKAEREMKVEETFRESESSHFLLRYEGSQVGSVFRADLLRTLDRQYTDLSRDFNFSTDRPITVILYTERQFFDVTQAPTWASGFNDGKMRIPVKDISNVTPELDAVLKHELTHSFVHALVGPRCPYWLNEGLAQMEEPRTPQPFSAALGEAFRQHKAAPLRVLEGTFLRFTPEQAKLAYAESLAAAEYLRTSYGWSGLRRILDRLAEGEDPESALRQAVQSNYARLEVEIPAYLDKR